MKHALVFLLVSGVVAGTSHAAAVKAIQPSMVSIKPGRFIMGSDAPKDAGGRHNPGEAPAHQVNIKPFRMAKYEVTVAQFRQFVDATGYQAADQCWRAANNEWGMASEPGGWDKPHVAQSEFHPVACVSWNDAKAYIKWLSAQTGQKYRLPSEAEWEYVARAGTDEENVSSANPAAVCRYANLSDRRNKAALKRDLNVADNGRGAPCDDMADYSTMVGMYEPNSLGLYDLSGNVAEWMEDCQHLNYMGAPADGSAWITNCDTTRAGMFIRRGGDYRSSHNGLRFALRTHGGQDNASSTDGFRLAMDGAGECTKAAGCAPDAASAAFEAALAKAQEAERRKRGALTPIGSTN